MQWKVALCQGRDCQYSLKRVTAVPSEAGPARHRNGCSTAWYRLHSQSTSQGWLPAGSNRLLSRQVNSSVNGTGSNPLPNLRGHVGGVHARAYCIHSDQRKDGKQNPSKGVRFEMFAFVALHALVGRQMSGAKTAREWDRVAICGRDECMLLHDFCLHM